MLSGEDLGPADRALLELLREGRIIAPFAADETGYSLQYVRDRLNRMVEHGNVEKVYDGLYELVEDPEDGGGTEGESESEEEPSSDSTSETESVLDSGTTQSDVNQASADEEDDIWDGEPPETIEGILDGWPGYDETKREERNEVGIAVLEWLRSRGDIPASASDVKEELLPQHSIEDQKPDTWWAKAARPALMRAVEAGVVEYREGHHDYRWIGDSNE